MPIWIMSYELLAKSLFYIHYDIATNHYYYSPMICSTSLRSLGLVSISSNTICCQVPSIKLLFLNGTVRLGPIKDARTWECPFPSCHVLLCSYSISLGAILVSIFGKSVFRPNSYSMVVIDAVEPDTKIVTIPSCSPLALMVSSVWRVMSIISLSPFELTVRIFVITDIHYNKMRAFILLYDLRL